MYFGIDLGTSNSAIAGASAGQVKIFKTAEGTDVMPSVIHRDRRGNQTVGVRAFDQANLAPDNAVDGFKRLMGTETPLRFASSSQTITPTEAATEVLRALVGQALVEAGGSSVSGAVVTIPAAFNQMQSESTLLAARAAGLDRVALLQEPVAAALAAMAGARERSGLFLIYDLGGGTFDAALVHAMDGDVTVLAHDGVNMLGGRDLDREILDNVALPWLKRSFELPSDFAVAPAYRRLIRMARRSAEQAKIALSTREETTITASDDEVRLVDLRGEPIYLDVPLRRAELETYAADAVSRSIGCCRNMLAGLGYRHEDIARVVLIGGPTKMPFLRRRVQDELGIQVEDGTRVDPMTAVASGAAIYCEGRDWSASGSTAKGSRRTESGGQAIVVSFDYESRTASDKARLTVTRTSGSPEAEVAVESFLGWSSGRRKLVESITLQLPLRDMGGNKFRATVFGADGLPVADGSREIVVERLLASTGGVPATQNIAAKILRDDGQNTLSVIVNKGTALPTTGVVPFRLAEPLRAGGAGAIRVELYQLNDASVLDPELNEMVGEFRINATDLPEASTLRRGDPIIIHWAMSEGQEITTEVELPSVGQRFDRHKFYNMQVGLLNFAGEEGGRLALEHLELAERDLDNAEEAVPPAHAGRLPGLRDNLEKQMAFFRGTVDPDARRQIVEETRLLRQQIAVVVRQPDARRHLLRRRLNEQTGFYQRNVRAGASRDQVAEVDTLLQSAAAAIEQGSSSELDVASEQIRRVNYLYWTHGLDQPKFCITQFNFERGRRHLASDSKAFDRFVAEGDAALANGDHDGVRQAWIGIVRGHRSVGPDFSNDATASLMRA